MERYKEKLVHHNIRPTYQRIKILEYLGEHQGHFTIDEVYDALMQEIPTLSKTTVYNTLQMLFKQGLAQQIFITGTEVRYEADTEAHHHLLCAQCGIIYDLKFGCDHFKRGTLKGHRIDEIHGYFKGVCASCLNKV